MIAGGTAWGIYEHQKVKSNNAAWLYAYPDCASGACTQDGYNHHTEYVWPHQVNRVIAFGTAGAGLAGLGVGMLVLGIPLMLLCFAFGTKRFFWGETLNATTEVKVPDTF